MTPAEYVEIVVLPTVREFAVDAGDRRRAYLATIAAYHVIDYILRANVPHGAPRPIRKAELERIERLIQRDGPQYFEVVEGMANGAKHCGRDAVDQSRFSPGDERYVPPYGSDPGSTAYDYGRWDGPGLLVRAGDGEVFVDIALDVFLCACLRHFPQLFPGMTPMLWRRHRANQAI